MPEPIDMNDIAARRVEPSRLDPRQMRQPSVSARKLEEGRSFAEVLNQSLGEVQRLQDEADATIRQVVSGEIRDVTDAMIAVEKADVAFQTMMGVRNKMVAAYEEIMRTQI